MRRSNALAPERFFDKEMQHIAFKGLAAFTISLVFANFLFNILKGLS